MSGAAGIAAPWRSDAGTLLRRGVRAGLVALLCAAAYFLWFRDSSLVAVRTVHIEGLPRGYEDLRQSLETAGRGMTTLHVQTAELDAAAQAFPEVAAVSADAHLPSTLTVTVRLRPPVGVVDDGDHQVPVAADGTLLPGVKAGEGLPRLPLAEIPRSGRLSGLHRDEAILIGSAPPIVRRNVESVFARSDGVGLTLDGGVELRFGTAAHVHVKWRAAMAVIGDPDLGALDYIDLRAPTRPAVGGSSYALPGGLAG